MKRASWWLKTKREGYPEGSPPAEQGKAGRALGDPLTPSQGRSHRHPLQPGGDAEHRRAAVGPLAVLP